MDKTYMLNLKWTTLKGFAASLTIQEDDLDALKTKSAQAMKAFGTEAVPQRQPAAKTPSQPAAQASSQPAAQEREGFCLLHEEEMQRFQKGNQHWFSHRDENGGWCKGKVA